MIAQTIIITGGTKGLGRATALAFAQAGHHVIAFYATDDSAAASLRSELQLFGGSSFVIKHDVSTENAAVWDHPEIQHAERLVLINNACAPFLPRPFHLLQWEDCERQLNVDLRGSWFCSRALLKAMVRAGCGTIVNVLTTAVSGLPPRGFSAYAIVKHAVRGLTLGLAAEYAAKGIRVFSVSPSFMATELTAKWDTRLVEAIRNVAATTDPTDAAQRIRELVEGSIVPGQGEDYWI